LEYWSIGVVSNSANGVVSAEIEWPSRLALRIVDSKLQLDQTFPVQAQLFQTLANPASTPSLHHSSTPSLHCSVAWARTTNLRYSRDYCWLWFSASFPLVVPLLLREELPLVLPVAEFSWAPPCAKTVFGSVITALERADPPLRPF
jgi:hypothetical protein